MSRCLVLGANGLIGSYLVDQLVAEGHTVRAFDRFSAENLNYQPSEKIEQFVGDFLNTDDLRRALKGVDYVFHFISTTTPITAENDPTIDIETNIRMSVELFRLCVEEGVRRVIYPSTGGAIYGKLSSAVDLHSENDQTFPVSPYAIGKLTIENYLHYFSIKYGVDYIIFRISNPFGNRQSVRSKQGVIPIFLDRVLKGEEITMFGDGSMIRDYIYVEDAVGMMVKAFNKSHKYSIYNIGSGSGSSVKEIIGSIELITKRKAKIKKAPVPATFVDKVVLDMTRFNNEFTVKPSLSLHDGIKATYESMIGK